MINGPPYSHPRPKLRPDRNILADYSGTMPSAVHSARGRISQLLAKCLRTRGQVGHAV
jgi:hypothetical protein